MAESDAFVVRRWSAAEALAGRGRLQAIFRDAVVVAGPAVHSRAQCAVWASMADRDDRWTPWLADGSTWIAVERDGDVPVGFAVTLPPDYVHLLYVDPAVHRRGCARMLLHAVERDARDLGIGELAADASLISRPVFEAAGYHVVAWEDVERGGQAFRRARMRKLLR